MQPIRTWRDHLPLLPYVIMVATVLACVLATAGG